MGLSTDQHNILRQLWPDIKHFPGGVWAYEGKKGSRIKVWGLLFLCRNPVTCGFGYPSSLGCYFESIFSITQSQHAKALTEKKTRAIHAQSAPSGQPDNRAASSARAYTSRRAVALPDFLDFHSGLLHPHFLSSVHPSGRDKRLSKCYILQKHAAPKAAQTCSRVFDLS